MFNRSEIMKAAWAKFNHEKSWRGAAVVSFSYCLWYAWQLAHDAVDPTHAIRRAEMCRKILKG